MCGPLLRTGGSGPVGWAGGLAGSGSIHGPVSRGSVGVGSGSIGGSIKPGPTTGPPETGQSTVLAAERGCLGLAGCTNAWKVSALGVDWMPPYQRPAQKAKTINRPETP